MTMRRQQPPYPRFGECISALAGAIDANKTGSDVGRLAREGDFDWERLDTVIAELLVDSMATVVGEPARQIFEHWVASVRSAYTELVLGVSLDALGRKDALPVLVEHFFAPAGGQLLRQVSTGVAKKSMHLQGKAVDLRLPGFSTSDLGTLARSMKAGGVGIYRHDDFVHIDTGKVRTW